MGPLPPAHPGRSLLPAQVSPALPRPTAHPRPQAAVEGLRGRADGRVRTGWRAQPQTGPGHRPGTGLRCLFCPQCSSYFSPARAPVARTRCASTRHTSSALSTGTTLTLLRSAEDSPACLVINLNLFQFLFCEVMNLIVDIVNIFLTDYFLSGRFMRRVRDFVVRSSYFSCFF